MPNRLDSLVIDEISIVDRPANSSTVNGKKVPRARIALYKRDAADDSYRENLITQKDAEGDDWAVWIPVEFSAKSARVVKAAKGIQFVVGFPKDGGGSQVQSVLFDKENWTADKAKAWLRDHDFEGTEVDETENTLRFRQKDPGQFERMRTITPGEAKKGDAVEDEALDEAEGGKTEDGTVFPASDYAYVPEKDKPSTWKLRLTSTPGGKPDAHIVGAAVAALGPGGFRGNRVQVPAEALPGVKAKVRAAWRSANPEKGVDEMPEVLRKGEVPMTIEEVVKKVEDQEAVIAALKADSDASRAETSAVLKMSKKERKLYAAMPEEKRKEFMAGDEEKRKAMIAECDKAAKEAKAKSGNKPDDEIEPDEDDDMEKARKVEKVLKAAEEASARLRKAEAQLEEFSKRDRLNRFTKRAETELPNVAGLPEDKGELLMSLAESLPGGEAGATFAKVMSVLKAADKALSIQFGEVGRPGGEIKAEAALNAKAAEIAKRDGTDIHHAMAKAGEEYPELWLEFDRERRELAPRQ